MLLTQKQYDFLITNNPNWMATTWLKLKRQWRFGGVRASGTEQQIEELCRLLKECQA